MGHLATVATCSLNQWAMDFVGNQKRIIESIRQAKEAGASLRIGPELEISGYGCADHHSEGDTQMHSLESLVEIISHPDCQDILLDIGSSVKHRNVLYNARFICYNKKVLLIRPKMALANDGNYYEGRWFTPWKGERIVEDFYLPRLFHSITGQKKCRIGDAVISTFDTCLGTETCEEMFLPCSVGGFLGLDGVEIISNSSGSHHELRKLDTRIELIRGATLRYGGIYLYSNQKGCDGDRLYYDGCAMIIVNGKIVAQGTQFSLNDVEVVTATVDIEEVRAYRTSQSRAMQAIKQPSYERIEIDYSLSAYTSDIDPLVGASEEIQPRIHKPEEEIALGPACWLWGYLSRSKQAGYFVPLSGGIDSCATSIIVYSMCRLVYSAVVIDKNEQVRSDLLKVVGEPSTSTWVPESAKEICSRLFYTAYMGMEKNSSPETRSRAEDLAKDIGAHHYSFDIDIVVQGVVTLFSTVTSYVPKYKMYGGSLASNLAMQNIQARLRMVLAYLFAQLLPTVMGRNANNPENQSPGALLVLGSANVDESLRGYLTKYDCSSADLNPIGSISKTDLKRFILWAATDFDLPILRDFIDAPPTAELEPITESYRQDDETDMGMTYNELSAFGKLRKQEKLGPWGMWSKLMHTWPQKSPKQIYDKVRWFFWCYAISRHKMTVLTPSYHAESYSPDDNRFDQRQFLYPPFEWAYRKIEDRLKNMGARATDIPKEVNNEETLGVGHRDKKTI